MTKYIFITGGVCSSLGKGLTAAAIGLLLERRGLKIAMLKLDPYLNVDPGTMNPFQHGEVYVTDDGAETDLDLGHYYRYTHSPLSKVSNATSGQIYNSVISRERRGDYLGNTVQVIPHITDEIKRRIIACGTQSRGIDLVLVEIGGTVGDIESLPFLEAIRQFHAEHSGKCLNIHLTYVPYLKAAGEIKTKPTQHSVQMLRQIGLFPNLIICRSECPLDDCVKEKISLFCNVPKRAVIEETDVKESIYELPLLLHAQGIDAELTDRLGFPKADVCLSDWEALLEAIRKSKQEVTVAIVGKYVKHQDAYKSVFEALDHASIANGVKLTIKRIEADKLSDEKAVKKQLNNCDGCLVPGGFGERGWQGKILAAKYCRETQTPYFGICLGMQVMTVEFARHAAGLQDANSTEIDPGTPHPVISLLSEQQQVVEMGGTMRLGAATSVLQKKSHAFGAYKQEEISERHRHRYEFNNRYEKQLADAGFQISGKLKKADLCEIVELTDHPWMVGVQFHPEFQSKPTTPHPLFTAFVAAMLKKKS